MFAVVLGGSRGWKPLAIVGSPVGASEEVELVVVLAGIQGLEAPGYCR